MFDEKHRGHRAARREGLGPDGFGDDGPRGRGGRGDWGPRRGGPGWGGPRGGRGGRARRGDVRAAIVALLAERPMHGYEMIQELSERTGGSWQPSPGSIYPTLTLLEEEGLVAGAEAGGKRQFTLTDAGREQAGARTGATPWEEAVAGADPSALALREVLGTTAQAVKQVFRAGTPAQQAKAAEILTEARRKLYELLASED